MKYIRPDSLTWWAGVFAYLVGLVSLFMPDNYQASELGRLAMMLAGGDDASPAGLMALGLGLIGIRAAIAQGGRDA